MGFSVGGVFSPPASLVAGDGSSVRGRVETTFDVTVDEQADRCSLELSGELDLSSAHRLRTALVQVQVRPRAVDMDLRRLTFVDSSGLAVIVAAHKRLTELGGSLRVTGATGVVRRVFELTGLSFLLADGDAA